MILFEMIVNVTKDQMYFTVVSTTTSKTSLTQVRQAIRTLLGSAKIRKFVQIFRSIPDHGSVLGDVLATPLMS